MSQFIQQFYAEAATIPNQLLLPQEIEEAKIISQWMRSRRGGDKFEMSPKSNRIARFSNSVST